ncbi:MAG: hypothetical protein Q7N50_02825, partial [Armatimonadota bacterium]|nr:hypothetical protein [Armatimonadota bacterium]
VGYRVSAANVIGVSFINATAVSVTPPTETYLVAHFQPLLGIGHWASQMVSPLAVQGVALTNEMQAVLSGTGLMAGS